MSVLIDRVADLLYPEDGQTTADIKFLSAGEPDVSAEQLAEMVHRAILHVRSGAATPVEDFTDY